MSKSNLDSSFNTISRWETPRLLNPKKDDADQSPKEDALKQAAHDEGFDQGYAAGIEQASTEINERIQAVNSFLNALSRPFNDQNHQLAEHIAVLAGKIAKSLVRRELRTEPETIMALVRDTVTALNTTVQDITVHLNPDNARIIRKLIKSDTQEKTWKIVDDPLISHSDCKVTSGDSLIDSDLQTRIDLIITKCLGDERSEGRT